MRKWNLLTMALLLAAGTVSITGCIDNDEPSGIENLRGAKAEWLLVKADFERVQVEIQKIELEKQKLELALKQIKLDSVTQIGQLEAELRVKRYEEQTLLLQKQIAEAEANYQKALAQLEVAKLTVRDSAFTTAIEKVSKDLSSVRNKITNKTAKLLDKKVELARATSATGAPLEAILEAKVNEAQVNVDIQKGTLADLTALLEVPVTEWSARIKTLEDEILQLQITQAENNITLEQKKAAVLNYDEINLNPITAKKEAKTPYTLTIPVAIQTDVFNDILKNETYFESNNNAINAVEDADGNVTLKGDFVGKGIPYNELAGKLDQMKEDINNQYETKIKEAYQAATGVAFTGQEVTDEDLALMKQKLSGLNEDLAKVKTVYETDLAKWENAVAAYQKGIKAFGNEIDNVRAQAWAEIDRFKKGSKDTATLKAKISAYCDVREALDSLPACKAMRTALKKNTDLANWAKGVTSADALGSDLSKWSVLKTIDTTAAKKESLIYEWIVSSIQVWGTDKTAATARLTVLPEDDATPAADSKNSFAKYLYYKNAVETINNADAWKTLMATIEADIQKIKADILDLETQYAEKLAGKAPVVKEQEDAQAVVDENDAAQGAKTKVISILNDALTTLGGQLQQDVSEEALKAQIAAQKVEVAKYEEFLAKMKALQEQYNEGLVYEDMDKQEESHKQYLEVISKEIENIEARIAELQKEFTILTQTKDNLLEAALDY